MTFFSMFEQVTLYYSDCVPIICKIPLCMGNLCPNFSYIIDIIVIV